jgi:hypothetical protein
MPVTPAKLAARLARIDAIHDAAMVRQLCGIDAQHHRLPDGDHQIIVGGKVYTGPTLAATIEAARGGRSLGER